MQANNKLEVVSKSIDLMKYVYTITGNRKHYPNKYMMLVRKIQETAMNIYDSLMQANRCHIERDKDQRLYLQTRAITLCDELSCFVQLSLDLNLISINSVEFWQKKISDVKYMTIAWRSKERG